MLELRNISYRVEDEKGQKEILRNINLTFEDHFTAITGPNGGGKSTLAKIIAGIYTPTTGQILLDGTDITNLSVTERARAGISFAFQQPVCFKGMTVKQLLSYAAAKYDADGNRTNKPLTASEACEFLSKVGLCARDYIARELNHSLSGGELKRIEIAMMIARQTPVSVFDEPEAGIDLWSFQNLISVFENLSEQINGNIIIISHQEKILNIADRVVVLADGEIQKVGTKEEVLPELLQSNAVCSRIKLD